MELSTQDIERIVSEVVRRLRQAGLMVESTASEQETVESPAVATTTCTLTEHVISIESIQDRLDNLQRLVVDARAVVTPAVHDLLRERNITLERTGS